MESTSHSAKVYWKNCGALMLLLALTWAIAYVDLGPFNLIVALAISLTKALLVALIFMHLKRGDRILTLAASVGIIWLLILLSVRLSDYFTRGWVPLNH